MALPAQLMAKEWTLKACIDYALQNNITLQKSRLNQLAAKEDIKVFPTIHGLKLTAMLLLETELKQV